MKLTLYLLRESVPSFDGIIPERYTQDGNYVEIEPMGELPFPCRAWLQQNKTKPPRWLKWLSTAFDLSDNDIVNQSNSFVLLVEAAGRRFAVTFGYGFNAIDRSFVEPDFGLKVTLNVVNPQALDTIDTRTLDRVTKQTRTHLNTGRPVEEFGIEPDLDWLRSVRGVASESKIDGKVQGADSIRVNWNNSFDTLADCCETLIELYQSDDYKAHYEFVDHLRPLPPVDPLIKTLDQKVIQLLAQRDRDWLMVAHPDVPSADVESFKIWYGNSKIEDIDELDLDVVFAFLNMYEETNSDKPDLHKCWVIALDGQGQARSHKTAIWKYLVVHVEHGGHTYVLSLGQWFQTDKDYLAKLRSTVEMIPDITFELDLPKWEMGEPEHKYNQRVATTRNWLLLDRQMFTFENATNKIECADLLTPERDFIHVKSMTSSATLSHLFAQGTVSARLFITIPEYRDKVAEAFRGQYTNDLNIHSTSRVVYAIGTSKGGPLAESLFFFSLVNLVQHKEMLDAMRWPLALCRIIRKEN